MTSMTQQLSDELTVRPPRRHGGWRALSDAEKRLRLEELRLRQQAQIELELRFLRTP